MSTDRPNSDAPRVAGQQPPAAASHPHETHSDLSHSSTAKSNARQPTPAPNLSQANAWIGRKLDRYELLKLLGTGGMGMVFLAHDTLIERYVAIKMLPEELAANETALARFLSEARAAGKLNHPNTVGIHEVDREGSMYYLVMEYVEGGTIEEELERGPISALAATQIIVDACRGLAAAHKTGLVHRDIKPANLLRSSEGAVKIADFGLAKQTLRETRQLTQEGSVAGTPYYMSPEQCESKAIDARSDIYSLGATYYSLLTGTYPYEDAGSIVQVMFAHCTGEVLDPRKVNAKLPAECSQIVAKATAKLPADRYQSGDEMLADLTALVASLSGDKTAALPSQSGALARASRRRWLVGGIAAGFAAAIATVAVLVFLRGGPPRRDDGPPGGAAAAPVFTGPPIQVGILHSLSGNMQESETPVVDATQLAIDELNAAGGVLGRKIEPLVRDGRSDPQVFAEEARKLIVDDKVCSVFGCWTSASRKTVVPIFERHNHLLVYPVQYEGLEQSPNVLYLGAAPTQQIIPAIRWAFAFQGKRKFFLVGSDYVFPRTAGAIIHDVLQELGGQIVGEEYLPLGSFDVDPIVAKIAAAQPDMIINTINGDSNVPFFRKLRASGITSDRVPTISFSIGEQEIRHLSPAHMAGDYAAWNYFQSLDNPANKAFVEKFLARYGAQRVVTDPMEAAYVGVKLWADAVRQAGDCNTAKIRKALAGQKIAAPEGEVTIDGPTQHAAKTPRVGQIQPDGQFAVVWTEVRPEKPVPFPPSRTRAAWEEFLQQLYTGWGNRWEAPPR